ncbi:MAG: sensor domain-containing diguanylate cyclase [Nitrospira sp.]|nr:sensor domain-containing diguanylate cyclase [Nitrospira sp.]
MKRLTPIFWMSLGLVSLTLSILLISDLMVGLIPDQSAQVLTYRQKYSEALAVQYSLLARRGDDSAIQQALDLLVERNEDIQSVALVLESGEIVALAGPHQEIWIQPSGTHSTPDHIQIPIFNGDLHWGTLQLRFSSLENENWLQVLDNAWVQFLALVMVYGFLGYFVYMKRTLRQLDPSSVVPMRVQAAFDVLAEGVVFLDGEDRIVLANRAFSLIVDVDPHDLIGNTLERFQWTSPDPANPLIAYPWKTARQEKSLKLDVPLVWERMGKTVKKFRVNCTPIFGERNQVRGILVSFNDVTELEDTIQELELSKTELEQLAHRDPLTGCCNRRALFEALEEQWEKAQHEGTDLVCIMADIDHFKSYNDRFGHAVGDQVIQIVAKVLSTALRPLDIIGRYGGEEFCILLPGQTCLEGMLVAERLRENIERLATKAIRTTSGTKITMSFGVSAAALGAPDHLELVSQADKALYAAKENGRNRVEQWTIDEAVAGPAKSEVVMSHSIS